MAAAHLDDDPYIYPFALLEGRQNFHIHRLAKVCGMLLPMGYMIGHGYANVIGLIPTISKLSGTRFTVSSMRMLQFQTLERLTMAIQGI